MRNLDDVYASSAQIYRSVAPSFTFVPLGNFGGIHVSLATNGGGLDITTIASSTAIGAITLGSLTIARIFFWRIYRRNRYESEIRKLEHLSAQVFNHTAEANHCAEHFFPSKYAHIEN